MQRQVPLELAQKYWNRTSFCFTKCLEIGGDNPNRQIYICETIITKLWQKPDFNKSCLTIAHSFWTDKYELLDNEIYQFCLISWEIKLCNLRFTVKRYFSDIWKENRKQWTFRRVPLNVSIITYYSEHDITSKNVNISLHIFFVRRVQFKIALHHSKIILF